MTSDLRLVFWESTKACNLTCKHCRAVPQRRIGPLELTTSRALDLIDAIAEVAKPVFVISGGEPLYRPDLFDIAEYGVAAGFRLALATNGTLVTDRVAAKIADTGFSRVAISLDGANAATHDQFRGLPGAHALALRGLRALRSEGVSIQINSTIARHNVSELKATCAPHYYRIRAQRLEDERRRGDFSGTFIAPGTKAKAAPAFVGRTGGGHPRGQQLSAMTRGCLAGTSVCFISNEGRVYPCGYLPVSAGDTRVQRFSHIWKDSPVFEQLRDPHALEGKCGDCRYDAICGGCRARAYAATGSFLAEEPFCSYRPDLDPRGGALEEARHDQQMH